MSLALMPSSLNLKWEGASSAFTITGESSTDWTCRSNCSWCRVSKTGNFTVGVTVERNTGASRTATVTVVCNSGTVSAKVYQRAYEVTYDRLSMIKPYHQPPDECAATCAAMCVKISPQELENMGCNMANADWSCIARKSGYTIYPSDGVAAGTLQNPVIPYSLRSTIPMTIGSLSRDFREILQTCQLKISPVQILIQQTKAYPQPLIRCS